MVETNTHFILSSVVKIMDSGFRLSAYESLDKQSLLYVK